MFSVAISANPLGIIVMIVQTQQLGVTVVKKAMKPGNVLLKMILAKRVALTVNKLV